MSLESSKDTYICLPRGWGLAMPAPASEEDLFVFAQIRYSHHVHIRLRVCKKYPNRRYDPSYLTFHVVSFAFNMYQSRIKTKIRRHRRDMSSLNSLVAEVTRLCIPWTCIWQVVVDWYRTIYTCRSMGRLETWDTSGEMELSRRPDYMSPQVLEMIIIDVMFTKYRFTCFLKH